jgi:hypothetical protein
MFIQIMQGKCSKQDEMRAMTERWTSELAPGATGWLGGTFGFTDDGQAIAVVRFESKEAAAANSERPEQAAWWTEVEKLYDGPVEFHDCDRVTLMMDGGSDAAGFVQIIRGKLDDPDAMESGMRDMEALLHEVRPEILGATLAIEDDGTFMETIAFTNESAAREGERKEVPEAAAEGLRQFNEMIHDVQYLDLHQPWFATKL